MLDFKVNKNEITGRWSIEGLPSRKTFDDIVSKISNNERFSFSRYGDGEFNCILGGGKKNFNCDGHQYFADLGIRLHEILMKEPEYIVGIQPLSLSYERADEIKRLYGELNINWVDADVLHSASIDGHLQDFVDAIKNKYKIIVGPLHLQRLFASGIHIVTPTLNCWLEYERIRGQISEYCDGINNPIILLSASMMSEVLVDDFHKIATVIDCGSVWDPYCGVMSRKYHFKLNMNGDKDSN